MSPRSDFKGDVRRFTTKLPVNLAAIHRGSVKLAKNSIQYGSPLTGAPGQPVDKGGLIASWKEQALGDVQTRLYTDSPSAQSNEDGIARPGGGIYRLLSTVGGRWSVRKTRDGFQRIVDYVARTLAAGRRGK